MSNSGEASSKVIAPVLEETERIDLQTELKNLKQSDQVNIKRMEVFNTDRVKKLTLMRRRNFLMGVGIAAGVFGIYSYTMGAVKQEGFLDDFDPPIPPSQKEINA